MSAAVIAFSPFIVACSLAALADIGLRIHGGLDTPTPAADAVLALGRGAVALLSAVVSGAAALLIGWRARP